MERPGTVLDTDDVINASRIGRLQIMVGVLALRTPITAGAPGSASVLETPNTLHTHFLAKGLGHYGDMAGWRRSTDLYFTSRVTSFVN